MLHEPIHQQLTRLGLRGAADALARLALDAEVVDTLAVLLEAECLHRDTLAQTRRLKLAKLGTHAHPADVDLRTPRGLGKARWQQLLSLNWLKAHRHLLLIGPTGIGKSWLACALAKAAIDHKHSVRYLRMPRLGEELAPLQAQGRLGHWLKTLGRIDLVILEDFGLVGLAPAFQPLLLELLEDRHQRGSVIVTSQLPLKLWHAQFQDPTLADAILDRLVHNAEAVEMTGESMRKRAPKSDNADPVA
jgi:DNA replication protein DnaC